MSTLKRIERDPARYEVVNLYALLARSTPLDLSDESSVDLFLEVVGKSLRENRKNAALIHGHRIEALFAYVVAGLGRARLLKQEDQGEVYASDDVRIPDYRIYLRDGTRLLVEVKNVHSRRREARFRLTHDYVGALQRYAEWDGSQLRFAIYYSQWAQWVLLPIEAFTAANGGYEIDMPTAFGRSEMAVLGDYMVGTTPDLEVLLEAQQPYSSIDSNNRFSFKPRRIRFFCRGVELTGDLERRLAHYFVRFGRWEEKEARVITEQGTVIGMRFRYAPFEKVDGQHFHSLGALSTMISQAFGELTSEDGQVRAISVDRNPVELAALVPEDYESDTLPLWRLVQQSSYDL